MTATIVLQSSFTIALRRYARSRGLWLLLLAAPIAGRTLAEGSWVHVTVEGHLPVMTSATLGATLGIIVATLVWPIGFVYLRSNAARRQPWQVEEVSPASRVAIAVGRFGADLFILLGALATLSVAGLLLGAFLGRRPLEPGVLIGTLWWIAAPALMLVAAQHILLDALRATRGALGDVGAFMLWMTALTLPAIALGQPSSLLTNMADPAGYVRPLAGHIFAVGGTKVLPGRVALNVTKQIDADGYRASRIAWSVLAIAIAVLSGLVYMPHGPGGESKKSARRAWLPAQRQHSLTSSNVKAGPARSIALGLATAEFKLIASDRFFLPTAAVVAIAGTFGDYRHLGSPAALLLLVFAFAAHAGRADTPGLLRLTRMTQMSPAARRTAFVFAGTAWGTVLAIPAGIAHASWNPIGLAFACALIGALASITLASATGSAFAPRITLLVGWYVYLAS